MPAGKEGAKVSSARAVSAVYLALWEPTSAPRLLSDVCSLMGLGKKLNLSLGAAFLIPQSLPSFWLLVQCFPNCACNDDPFISFMVTA